MEEIEKLIEIYFEMGDGEHIKNYQNEILLFQEEITIKVTHRILKHIVEQRKKDSYTAIDLKDYFNDINRVLKNNSYKIIDNRDLTKNTFLLVENVFDKKVGVVLVLEIVIFEENSYFIKTGFYRAVTKIKKLLN